MPRIVDEATRQATRERILREAAREFARLGFDQANINHIADHAEIGRGTLYLYFESNGTFSSPCSSRLPSGNWPRAGSADPGKNPSRAFGGALPGLYPSGHRRCGWVSRLYERALWGQPCLPRGGVGVAARVHALMRQALEDTLPPHARGRVDLDAAALLVLSATESLVLSARVLGYDERRLAEMAPLSRSICYLVCPPRRS